MRAAAIQFKPSKGDPSGSRERLLDLAWASSEPLDLLVLPEMATSGYVFAERAEILPLTEPARGPSFQAFREVARGRKCWVVAGYPERDGERLFNSAMVIDPAGELAFNYRKTLLYDADTVWALPGDSGYRAFSTEGGRFGVGICMDLNDPRFLLWCYRARLDAIAFPTNWVEEGMDVWTYWRDRIAGTGAALVAANAYGTDGSIAFSGCSAILDRDGVLAAAPREGDAVIRASLVREARRAVAGRR